MKTYYVWADSDCADKTNSLEQALQWVDEYLAEGKEDVYIVDENNDYVFVEE